MANEKEKKKIDVKTYPFNLEAEKKLLSALLIDYEFCSARVSMIKEEDFFIKENGIIFSAIKELIDKNQVPDITTVDDILKKTNGNQSRFEYLAELTSILTSSAGAQSYIYIVKRDSILRKIISSCNAIIEKAYNSEDAEEILRFVENLIYEIGNAENNEKTNDVYPIEKAMVKYLDYIDKVSADPELRTGLKTGYPIFDSITNGFQPGNLIVLAARPGVGKTAFALNIALGIDKKYNLNRKEGELKKNILLYVLEMTDREIVERCISNLGSVAMDSLKKFDLDASYENLYKASSLLSKAKSGILLNDASNVNANDVLMQAKRFIASSKGTAKQIDLIIIDYIGLMGAVETDRNDNLTQKIGNITRRLKNAARELKCPILILSQMSRKIEEYGRNDKTPQLSDLRDSGNIEQDADIVMFLQKEKKNEDSNSVILAIEKNRHGMTKMIR